MSDRYEVLVYPSFYDSLKKGKEDHYSFESHLNPKQGTYGANVNNECNLLKDVKSKDSLIFKVVPQRIIELGNKGVEYENELEKVVERIVKEDKRVYIYFKK